MYLNLSFKFKGHSFSFKPEGKRFKSFVIFKNKYMDPRIEVELPIQSSYVYQTLFDLEQIHHPDEFKPLLNEIRNHVKTRWEAEHLEELPTPPIAEGIRFLRELKLAAKGTQILKFTGDCINLDLYPYDISLRKLRKYLSQLKGLEIKGRIINSFNDVDLNLKYFTLEGSIYESFNRCTLKSLSMDLEGQIEHSFSQTQTWADRCQFKNGPMVNSFNCGSIQAQTFKTQLQSCTDSFNKSSFAISSWFEIYSDQIVRSWIQLGIQSGDITVKSTSIEDSFKYLTWVCQGEIKFISDSINDSLLDFRATGKSFTLKVDQGQQIGLGYIHLTMENQVVLGGEFSNSFRQIWIFTSEDLSILGSQDNSFNHLRFEARDIRISGQTFNSFNHCTIRGQKLTFDGTEGGGNLNNGTIDLVDDFIYHKDLNLDQTSNILGCGTNLNLTGMSLYVQSNSKLLGSGLFFGSMINLTGEIHLQISNRPIFRDFSLIANSCLVSKTLQDSFNSGNLQLQNNLVLAGCKNSFNSTQVIVSQISITGPLQSSFNLFNLIGSQLEGDIEGNIEESLSSIQVNLSRDFNLRGNIPNTQSTAIPFDGTLIRCQNFNLDGSLQQGFRSSCVQVPRFRISGPIQGDSLRDTFICAQTLDFSDKIAISPLTDQVDSPRNVLKSSGRLFESHFYPLSISSTHLNLGNPFEPRTPMLVRNTSHVDIYPRMVPGLLQDELLSASVYPEIEPHLNEFKAQTLILEDGIQLSKIQDVLYRTHKLVINGLVGRNELAGINPQLIEVLEINAGVLDQIFYGLSFPKLRKLVLTSPEVDCLNQCNFPALRTLIIRDCSIPLLTLKAKPYYIELVRSHLKLPRVRTPKIYSSLDSSILGKDWSAEESYNLHVNKIIRIPKGYEYPIKELLKVYEKNLSLQLRDMHVQNGQIKRGNIVFNQVGMASIKWKLGEISVEQQFHVT